jgi:hypothetical protein
VTDGSSAWTLVMAGSLQRDRCACAGCDGGRSKGLKEAKAGRWRSDRWVGFLRDRQ